MHPISGNTTPENRLWNDDSYSYGLSYVNAGGDIGTVAQLNGGFYQGFYKLQGYDYEVLPTRMSQGWTVEMMLKYRFTGDTNVGLNARYPENKGTFFFMGSRAENKFYHYADGSPSSDTGYTRVTSGLTCMHTCGCSITGGTGADCIPVYQPSGVTSSNCNCGCPCSCSTEASVKELDPLYDGVSNAMSIRFSGDTGNPRVCVKEYLITGSCIPSGSCLTATTFVTGVTTVEWCSTRGIFEDCKFTPYINLEHWVQIDAVFERNAYYDCKDLDYLGGLGQIEKEVFTATSANNSVSLVVPPITHEEGYDGYKPAKTTEVHINDLWLQEREYRLGKLKIFVNGKLLMVCEDFEEIIPRPLNTYKERQVGVPFNISVGGGTQGLKDNLTFSGGCPAELSEIVYQQDPECLTTEDLDNTIYSGLSTNIYLEEIFGGSFIGAISAFRMYVEPLDASEVKHNFRLLKTKYGLLDPDCPDCAIIVPFNDLTYLVIPDEDLVYLIIPDDDLGYILIPENDLTYEIILETTTPTPTPTNTPTETPTNTPAETLTNTPTVTQTQTPTNTPSVTNTNTPTHTQTSTVTQTPTNTPTRTLTPSPTATVGLTPTATETQTSTPTETPTNTPTETVTPTLTETPTNTPTETPTNTPTETPTNTVTQTVTPTSTETPTNTPSETPTNTPTGTTTSTPTITPSPTETQALAGRILYWDFSNPTSYSGTSTVFDLENNSNGTIMNSPSSGSTGCGTYIDFNGTSQYIYSDTNLSPLFAGVSPNKSEVTSIFMWIYPEGDGVIVSEVGVANSLLGWHTSIIEMVSGTLKFGLWNGTANSVVTSSIPTPFNNWYYIGMTYDGSTLTAYVDGVSAGNITFNRQAPYNVGSNGLFYLLAHQDGTNMGDGGFGDYRVGSFEIYTTSLSLGQINNNYNTQKNNYYCVTPTPTSTPTPTETQTATPTNTETPTGTPTETPTGTPTNTPTNTETPTNTPTETTTSTPTNSPSETPTNTPSETPTNTPTPTNTETPTNTPSVTITGTPTSTLPDLGFLLQEDTFMILQEDSSGILIEPIQVTPTPTPAITSTTTPTPTTTPTITATNTVTPTQTLTPSSTPNVPVTNNLVLYYDPSNSLSYSGSGTVINDLSGNGLNGTMSNITFTSPYFTYNGTSSQIQVVDNVLLEPGSGDWTMEVWVNQSVSGNDVVLGKFDNGGQTIDVSYSIRTTNTTYYAQLGSGSGSGSSLFVNSTNYVGTIGSWSQIVYVFTNIAANTLQTFVNGSSIGTVGHNLSSILNSTNPLYIGSYNGGEYSQWFDGKIGIVRLYNVALTSSQVLQNYNADKSKYGL